ncbi:MAG: DUF4202 domain-containing protein [Dehalococcoidia bacterium]
MTRTPFERAVEAIQQANSNDPRTELVDGVAVPWEIAHANALVAWIERLQPAPSQELLLAAYGQHIRRWEHPRSEFPEGRTGYLRWRTTLYRFHATACARLLRESDVSEAAITRVEQLVSKQCPRGDAEAQALEDALCLVFLERQFAALAGRLADSKTVDVVRKTWRKMSPAAHEAALALPLSPSERDIIQRALAPD